MEFKMAGDQNLVGLAFIKFVGGMGHLGSGTSLTVKLPTIV